MVRSTVSRRLDVFLTKRLSSSVFTWREILNLAVPSILDSVSIMFINMLITALISKNGVTSMAAVSLVGPITSLISCLFNGIGAGGTVVVAQCCGKKDPALVNRAIGMILWVMVLVGCLTCLPFLLFPRQILLTLYPKAEAAVLEKACVFLTGCIWSIMIFTVYSAIFCVLRGLGQAKKCLVLSIIINVAYLLFSILFLNWLNMDIQGSVLALLLARFLGAAAAVVSLFFFHPPVSMNLRHFFSYDHSLMGATMQVSIPFGVEQICISCGSLVSQMFMTSLGTTALATQAITNSLLGLLYCPAGAVGNLAVAVVGRCIGAGRREEAYQYGRRCNQIALLLLIVSALIFYPLLPMLLRQYNPTAEEFTMARMLLLANLPFLLLFWPMGNIIPSTLRAASDTVFPSVASLIVLWVVNTGLGYVLAIPMGLGLWGVWIATWCSWIVRMGCFYLRFRSRKWLYKSTLAVSGDAN